MNTKPIYTDEQLIAFFKLCVVLAHAVKELREATHEG